MSDKASAPIGIFDSGIGGLTVARAVKNVLPNEQIIYFGDTAHLPYGDKSTAAIQAYAVKIADVLLKANCKLILIACNSASTAAFELVKAYVASKAEGKPSWEKSRIDRDEANGEVRGISPKSKRFGRKHPICILGHSFTGADD